MKVVINTCYGGFGLSEKAMRRYSVLKFGVDKVVKNGSGSLGYITIDNEDDSISEYDIDRDDPLLVQVVQELVEEADGFCSELVIKEIPDGSEWEIEEYDGRECLRKPVTYY